MKIKDIMIADGLESCRSKTPLNKAAKTMKLSNCGALPVVNKKKEVIGIITDRDICLSLAKKNNSAKKTMVKQIMRGKVHTVNLDDELSAAFQQMRTRQVGRLPVVDNKGKLKGIVSLHDLIGKSIKNGQTKLSDAAAGDENLLKTLHAVSNRYNGMKPVKGKKKKALKKAAH